MTIGSIHFNDSLNTFDRAGALNLVSQGYFVVRPSLVNCHAGITEAGDERLIHVPVGLDDGSRLVEHTDLSINELYKQVEVARQKIVNALNSGHDVMMPVEWFDQIVFPASHAEELTCIEYRIQATIMGLYGLYGGQIVGSNRYTHEKRAFLRQAYVLDGIQGINAMLDAGKSPSLDVLANWKDVLSAA